MPITINGSGSILGVSTLTQLSTLDVGGNVSVGGTLTYEDVSNIDAIGVVTARSGIHFGTVASGTLVVGDGNGIGIGTDNPGQELEVFSDDFTGVRIKSSRTGLTEQIGGVGFSTSSDQVATINALVDGTVIVKNTTSDTERFRIDSAGNVGIGTDNPGVRLNVRQDSGELARFQINNQTSSGRIVCVGGTASYAGINFGDLNDVDEGRIRYYNDENSDAYQSMLFYTNNSERLRIGSAGQIGLSGANYGTARQVLKSNGSNAAPTWSDLYSFYFYGEQDAQQGSWPNATYKKLQNLGNYAVNIGPSSIATWEESNGNLTIGADGAGYWFLSMGGGIDDIQDADFVQVVIGKNGGNTSVGTRVSSYSRAYSSSANQIANANVSCIANLSAGDVVRFYLYHQEGTADEHSEPSRCYVMGYKI